MSTSAEPGLERRAANCVPLSPLSFLKRTAAVYPHKTAVIHGARRYSYRELLERCVRLASALRAAGVADGDTVSVLAPNVPAMLEAHYGVPMAGAVLNTINTRLDAASVGFILGHARSRILIADAEYAALVEQALAGLEARPTVIGIADVGQSPACARPPLGDYEYEDFLAGGDPGFAWTLPADEWATIALNYTSGTTGAPKGVVYHHRGAYLNAMGNALAFQLSPDSVYLWTLPMFHCNGWSHTWAVTLAGGTHVCLRRVEAAAVFDLIARHRVTHLCGAPVVLNMLSHAPERPAQPFRPPVAIATGGAAPPGAVIERMEAMGFRVTHLYGLTETYGPAALCAWQPQWAALDLQSRTARLARQGVPIHTQEDVVVLDRNSGEPIPCDGNSIGEICIRGNTVMKGYLDNATATEDAFAGGWFHTGDLAVVHADGYIEIKDRAKDVIISGGENISTLEVEEALYRHPLVLEAAVVARPDEKWGETPCAFVTLKPGTAPISEADLIAWCREHLAHFKCPRTVVFADLPKTATGKIQKFQLRERARTLQA
ncbi:acyl-CoA synthetase [Azoarcus sp. KH32C]|uniref:acyl-CoA synthetase n=1 Tax=Azoarcus sp. KH32C TaxID=748247 RepID=UPI000238614E|nr:acyl-CoA synthetase [Azoarcus sp. KH32C]BAL24569.1 acetyl-CoA synthetase [Azoarcus sp. KH32C]